MSHSMNSKRAGNYTLEVPDRPLTHLNKPLENKLSKTKNISKKITKLNSEQKRQFEQPYDNVDSLNYTYDNKASTFASLKSDSS